MDFETKLIQNIAAAQKIDRNVLLMEVCGTHTMSIFKHGIKSVLPENIKLVSGPGCPVCVTPPQYIDQAVFLAESEETIICTFGDMMRVPGEETTLENSRAQGADIRVIYSPMDCLEIAEKNPHKRVVLLAVGFETTSPVIGITIEQADRKSLDNLFVLSGLKRLFPALHTLLDSGELNINGLICPGHVSSISGEGPYRFIPEKHGIPCVISGFGSADILMGIYMLVLQIAENRAVVENAYRRAGTVEGNSKALDIIRRVFNEVDDSWRGLGVVPGSGLDLADVFRHRDARSAYYLERPVWTGDGACSCGDIIKGIKVPSDCELFGNVCTPENPVGACMISGEGTCAAYYRYTADR